MRSAIVSAPATVANVGPGFDILSFALEGPRDVVRVTVSKNSSGIIVHSLDPRVPSGEENVAYIVAKAFLEKLGVESAGLEITVDKGVPPSRGLGSSAATAVATAMALAVALGVELGVEEVISIAARGEEYVSGSRHFDNVAASLLGGFVISNPRGGEFIKIEPPVEVPVGVVIPLVDVPERKTGYARSLLPRSLSLEEHVAQSFNIAKLVYSISAGDLKKIGEAVSFDVIAEPRRSQMIPYYGELKKLALDSGALGFNISGAGPSVFFIAESIERARRLAERLRDFLADQGVIAETIVSTVSARGAEVLSVEES
ncbi:MAG: homoserine kinase [Acidilobaceae archaeon]